MVVFFEILLIWLFWFNICVWNLVDDVLMLVYFGVGYVVELVFVFNNFEYFGFWFEYSVFGKEMS